MYAVKGNKEVKIIDIQKDEYLNEGYKILDDNFKVIEEPSNATISLSEHKRIIALKDKKITELEKKLTDLTKKIK